MWLPTRTTQAKLKLNLPTISHKSVSKFMTLMNLSLIADSRASKMSRTSAIHFSQDKITNGTLVNNTILDSQPEKCLLA